MVVQIFSVFICILSLQMHYSWAKIGDDHFDYFVYTQQWPQSACIDANDSHHVCKMPNNVTTWTIHGLWPNKYGEKGPNFCNNSSPFNFGEIAPLEGRLLKYWPNLYSDTPLSSFWEHEWTKHGTCAASEPTVKGEYNYFNVGLKLNQGYLIYEFLKKHNIVPGVDASYMVDDVTSALKKELNQNALAQCIYDNKTSRHYLVAVEICFSKSFSPIDCDHPQQHHQLEETEYCPKKEKIYYTPIQHGGNV